MNTVTLINPITGEEEVYAVVTVSCQSPDCANLGIEFDVPDSSAQCGDCGEWIIQPPQN